MRDFRPSVAFFCLAVLVACGDATTGDSPSRGQAGAGGATAGAAGSGAAGSAATGGSATAGAAGHGGVAGAGAGGPPAAGAGGTATAGRDGAGGNAGFGDAGGSPGNAGAGGLGAGGGGASSAGSSGAAGAAASAGTAGAGGGTSGECTEVTAVPDAVRSRLDLDAFYEKHVDARGLSILSSAEPSDESLLLACRLLNNMLSTRDDVREELIRRKARFAIIGKDEGTADIPEYGYRDGPQEDIDYINERARGLGGIVASCGEENILCLSGDRYPRESICVHEFSHTIATYGLYSAEDGFEDALEDAYDAALASGILDDSYRNSNLQEYWAEGVQDWYDTNDWSSPPNGIHNSVNTRVELESYDPTLYELVAEVFPEVVVWGECRAD